MVTANDEAVIRTPLEERLPGLDPETFWQIHRSVIVRVSAIAQVRRDELRKLALSLKGRAGNAAGERELPPPLSQPVKRLMRSPWMAG